MCKNKKRFKKSVELFNEKSGNVVRVIKFENQKDFDNFLYGYNSMRYPGYKWRFVEARYRNKKNITEQN
jgi:hypothetical protein